MDVKNEIISKAGINEMHNHDYVVKRQEAEARIMEAFARIMREITSLKHTVRGGMFPVDSGEESMSMVKYNKMLKQKLYQVAMEKLELTKGIIQEIFGEKEKPKEEDDDMEY
tara:strand:+ start:349 stop:684 length:336 start_codon:yes stop_codon:yes gene_type:complete